MSKVSNPRITINKLPSTSPAGLESQKVLVIGQKLASGASTAGQLLEDVKKSDIAAKFGTKSMIGGMLASVFKIYDDSKSRVSPQVDVIPLDDASGTATEFTLTFTDSGATGLVGLASTFSMWIGSENFTIDTTATTPILTAGSLPELLAASINSSTTLPVSAAEALGVVTLTYAHDGTVGNSTVVKIDNLVVDGANDVYGNAIVVMVQSVAGATDPTAPVLDAVVGDTRYQTIVHPSEYGTSFSVDDFLDTRFNINNEVLDGLAIIHKVDTLSNLKTYYGTQNTQNLSACFHKVNASNTWVGSSMKEFGYNVSSQIAAIRSLRLTDGANITRFTPAATSSPLDSEGGIAIASLPYFNSALFDLPIMDTASGFTSQEIEELKDLGGFTVANNRARSNVIMGQVTTTYKTDVAGNPDSTWHYLNQVDTISVVAEYFFNNMKQDFVQHRLTSGNLIGGRAIVNLTSFKGQLKKYYIELSKLALVPAGDEAIKFFLESIVAELDLVNGKITASADIIPVVQLREIILNLKTRFEF